MAQNEKGRRRANGIALTHNFEKRLASHEPIDTAPEPVRQVAPAAWIARRFGLPPATAALVVELAGIGAAL